MNVKTNNVPRHVICGYELTDKEKKQFDYISDDELDYAIFFKYKGRVYDLDEFCCCPDTLKPWHGYFSDSFFSGVVVKYVSDNEQVIVGTYYC